ncbi:odorant receptor 88a [Drosophila navojoa]|uniref:odorant receptor 88a n=1 Tax=Drosophila navojoa TaxID=7232 RepID=UPI0011BF8E09|nr:odorant receptor 88a [Drosophila navojoa]
MDNVIQPIKIESFFEFQKFQQFFHLLHFKFYRNDAGRIVNRSELVFFTGFSLDIWFFGVNLFDIFWSMRRGVPSSQNLPVLSISVYYAIRGILLYTKRHEIIDFINVMDREFPRDLPTQQHLQVAEIFEQHKKRKGYVGLFAYVALGGFSIAPIIFYILAYEDRNAPILLDQQLLGGWLPYNIRQIHLLYPFVWIYDVYAMLVGVTYFTTFDTLFIAFQTLLRMHLNGLRRQIEQLNADDSENPVDEQRFFAYISSLIRRHQEINVLCDKFNDLFKLAIFLSDLVGATSICFHLYLMSEASDKLMIAKFLGPTMALVAFTFECCLRGSQLEEASAGLNEALYNHSWYHGSKKYRKVMLIWIKYSQCTRKLTAYGLVEVNMMHFTDIMQLAYRLFTFLKSRQ